MVVEKVKIKLEGPTRQCERQNVKNAKIVEKVKKLRKGIEVLVDQLGYLNLAIFKK